MDIEVKELTHIYQPGSPFEQTALTDVSLSIASGSFVSILGHTGSGKSTLIQHFNGLLKPTDGGINLGSTRLTSSSKKQDLRDLRKKVGMVFQYPEHQLFEETVEKDICFGPKNYGITDAEAKTRAHQALERVGLPESILNRSPFDLSGGQMRRVAIAGVLALEPEVLVLDEPAVGLDPLGRRQMLALFDSLHKEHGLTTIMVTHNMDDAAVYSERIFVMDHGRLTMEGSPVEVFSQMNDLKAMGLDVPEPMRFAALNHERLNLGTPPPIFTTEDACDYLADLYKQKKEGNGR